MRRTRNRRACMIRCINVNEAREVCNDRSGWRSVVSAYPYGKKPRVYVCMILSIVALSRYFKAAGTAQMRHRVSGNGQLKEPARFSVSRSLTLREGLFEDLPCHQKKALSR